VIVTTSPVGRSYSGYVIESSPNCPISAYERVGNHRYVGNDSMIEELTPYPLGAFSKVALRYSFHVAVFYTTWDTLPRRSTTDARGQGILGLIVVATGPSFYSLYFHSGG